MSWEGTGVPARFLSYPTEEQEQEVDHMAMCPFKELLVLPSHTAECEHVSSSSRPAGPSSA